MHRPTIDLRSDTVTKPCPAMRRAMAEAEVGDDVIDVDPTLQRLEQTTAQMLGKEAAIFMPSGSMTNQIAIRLHCQPGDEFLCEEDCHIYNYEQAAFAQLSGIVARTIKGDYGTLHLSDLRDKIRPPGDHLVRTRLLCLENTHNRAGGRVQPWENFQALTEWAGQRQLVRHLDGARLFNAVVATGVEAHRWAELFDTVSVCFSKGLGAPVGSALAGPRELIRLARRHRKVFGGGMRQAGIIAAGALYALEHNIPRLAEDHEHAVLLGQAIGDAPGLRMPYPHVESNMVMFEVDAAHGTARDFVDLLADRGVKMLPMGTRAVRAVTHLDIARSDILEACRIILQVAEDFSQRQVPAV